VVRRGLCQSALSSDLSQHVSGEGRSDEIERSSPRPTLAPCSLGDRPLKLNTSSAARHLRRQTSVSSYRTLDRAFRASRIVNTSVASCRTARHQSKHPLAWGRRPLRTLTRRSRHRSQALSVFCSVISYHIDTRRRPVSAVVPAISVDHASARCGMDDYVHSLARHTPQGQVRDSRPPQYDHECANVKHCCALYT